MSSRLTDVVDVVTTIGSAVWEWLPDFYSGNADEGGTVFVVSTSSFSLEPRFDVKLI